MRFSFCALGLCVVFVLRAAVADPAPFDLAGPKLQVEVTRAGKTLPIAAVPNLQAGDQLAIRTEFPKQQAVHYLLIAAFLRGSTNPPPENWFFTSESWKPKQSAGLRITVPDGAEQLLLFLAPETGGAVHTLVSAVRGRPGAFVRAVQDLNEAALERARLDVYLAAIRRIGAANADQLKTASPLLTRSLGLKLNADCFDKPPEQQAACLTQGRESLILNDGHSASVAAALTSGNSADLILSLSETPKAGSGYNSPYISSVMDIARILDSFHTAQYQYIPALSEETGKEIALVLNTPPSFYNPKSVLVIALPAIQKPQAPPLRPVDPKSVYCAGKSNLVLPVEGAPLVFATGYAHDMALRLKRKDGKMIEEPLAANAEKGGLVASTSGLTAADFGDAVAGSLHGSWGFESFDGPEFHLENARPQHWRPAEEETSQLVAGHDFALHLETDSAACVDSVTVLGAAGQSLKSEWKADAPNRIEVKLPLKKLKAGPFKLVIRQFGGKDSDAVALRAYAPAGRLDAFVYHLGDGFATLKGERLEEVKEAALKDARFRPAAEPEDGALRLTLVDAKTAAALKPGDSLTAEIFMQDGRTFHLETTIASARPAADLLARGVRPAPVADPIHFKLTDESEVPAGAALTFSLQARVPTEFSGAEKVEAAAEQGAAQVTLAPSNGLVLEDAKILLATLDTAKMLPPSAAGPLRFRLVKDGIHGDWRPLATLVRLPSLHELACAADHCTLSGNGLFLIDAISADPQFADAVRVPAGYPGFTLATPAPVNGRLYVKLHDAPAIVNEIVFPITAAAAPGPVAPPAPSSASQPAAAQPGATH